MTTLPLRFTLPTLTGLGALLLFVACSSDDDQQFESAARAPTAVADVSAGVGPGEGSVEPGTLTAGTWDDNLNFERFLDYRSDRYGGGQEAALPGRLNFTEGEHIAAQKAAELQSHAKLDVALVIDTTGSMLDELVYLQTEFEALSESIEAAYPEAEQRWSLVVYRDAEDEYETRVSEFRQNLSAFRDDLGRQSSVGGGDYPEASHAALEAMNQLAWRGDDRTARIAFWVADAPHHERHADELAAAIRTAAAQGVHLYPVASSGVDELTELSMRTAAQITGGRYLFLTDDSGVGGEHKEPSIPCYFVTRLDDAILRMVSIEMSGEYRRPVEGQIIRTGGDPEDGACSLESGDVAVAF